MTAREKVQSLLTAANTATGESDDNLTDAVGSLIAGHGGGAELPFSTHETVTIGANDITHNEEIVSYFYPAEKTAVNQLVVLSPESVASVIGLQMIVMHHFHASSLGNWVGGVSDYMLVLSGTRHIPYAPSGIIGRDAKLPEGSKYNIYTFGGSA